MRKERKRGEILCSLLGILLFISPAEAGKTHRIRIQVIKPGHSPIALVAPEEQSTAPSSQPFISETFHKWKHLGASLITGSLSGYAVYHLQKDAAFEYESIVSIGTATASLLGPLLYYKGLLPLASWLSLEPPQFLKRGSATRTASKEEEAEILKNANTHCHSLGYQGVDLDDWSQKPRYQVEFRTVSPFQFQAATFTLGGAPVSADQFEALLGTKKGAHLQDERNWYFVLGDRPDGKPIKKEEFNYRSSLGEKVSRHLKIAAWLGIKSFFFTELYCVGDSNQVAEKDHQRKLAEEKALLTLAEKTIGELPTLQMLENKIKTAKDFPTLDLIQKFLVESKLYTGPQAMKLGDMLRTQANSIALNTIESACGRELLAAAKKVVRDADHLLHPSDSATECTIQRHSHQVAFQDLKKFSTDYLLVERKIAESKTDTPHAPEKAEDKEFKHDIRLDSECAICGDENPRLIAGPAQCQCFYQCPTCVSELADSILAEPDKSRKCQGNCKQEVALSYFEQAGVSEEKIQALVKQRSNQELPKLKQHLATIPGFRRCTGADGQCLNGKMLKSEKDEKEQDTLLDCPVCDQLNCVACSKIHPKNQCPAQSEDVAIQLLLEKGEKPRPVPAPTDPMADNFEDGKFWLCPHCALMTERIDGCNYMRCEDCSKPWHWTTGEKITEYEYQTHALRGFEKLFGSGTKRYKPDPGLKPHFDMKIKR